MSMNRRPGLALIACCAALGGGLLLAPAASAAVSCAYVDGGLPILPQGNVLEVTLSDDFDVAAIKRSGDEIVVRDYGRARDVTCSGGTATVATTDSITVSGGGGLNEAGVHIDLGGGPLAPGATAEPDGSSEIEIAVDLPGSSDFAYVDGSGARDEIRFGTSAGAMAANLNSAAEPPGAADADLTIAHADFTGAFGRGGNDLLTAAGGPGLDGPLSRGGAAVVLFGAGGNDRLVGHGGDDLAHGGSGNDSLDGGAGSDFLFGERGRDEISAGRGADLIGSRDGTRDRVNCGRGNDNAFADRQDRLASCQRAPGNLGTPRILFPGAPGG
jgi:Ca2+-binding RTX toxin-like protein